MNLLSISKLNNKSPYKLSLSGEMSYTFTSDNGIKYEIGFVEDYMLGISDVYQFFLEAKTAGKGKTIRDSKISATISAVLEEFFDAGSPILDYICDTGDGRQGARSRLFNHWYLSNPKKDSFTLRTITALYEGVEYYASVIIRNDNLRFSECMMAIDSFSKSIEGKLR